MPFPPHLAIYVRSRREIFRWYESEVPWGHLNDEGETEPEGVYDSDSGPDDDDN